VKVEIKWVYVHTTRIDWAEAANCICQVAEAALTYTLVPGAFTCLGVQQKKKKKNAKKKRKRNINSPLSIENG
jgi:hypothetical protein